MSNEDGSIWIVFNGAIYNYLELRRELMASGHRFKSHCDTEVIIHAYEDFGADCVQHFNGMFAFCLLDQNKGEVFLERDRLGVKPLYYSWSPGFFAFASEIKAILATQEVQPEVDLQALQEYLIFQFCLDDRTLFQKIYKLPPGHTLTLRVDPGNEPQLKKYWDLRFQYDLEHKEAYFVDRLQFLLEDAVRLRLRSDVPLGSHLSGGLDSSIIACVASSLLEGNPVQTFTGTFREGKEFDESRYALMVSQYAKTTYNEIALSADDFVDCIEKLMYFMDEPAAGLNEAELGAIVARAPGLGCRGGAGGG
jgi:asparagine synthase (glutamine-hydrolysing)